MSSEWSVLLAACAASPPAEKRSRLLELLGHPVNCQALISLADRHGTQPLLHRALLNVEEAAPRDAMLALKQSSQSNLHKALLLARELIRIVGTLSAAGLEVMPYKGSALAELVYGDIALRQAGDIDLLIRPADFARIREVIRELGYAPHERFSAAEERAYLKSAYECAFDGAAGRNLLELQWAVLPRFYAVNFDMDGVFGRAVNVNVAGRPMRTPSAADLFLILSVHAAKHVWGRLVWLCDIARLMNMPGLDWGWIRIEANELGILRILRVTMLLVNRLLGAAIPAAARELVSKDGAAELLTEEITNHILSDRAYNVESVAYFRLMMRLREKSSDRLRFLSRLIFTSGPSEWKAVRLPESLFPLYRMVRLTRLAARLVRG